EKPHIRAQACWSPASGAWVLQAQLPDTRRDRSNEEIMADLRQYQSRVVNAGARADAAIDQGLRAYMIKVYNLMALGLLITGLAAFGTVTLATSGTIVATLPNGIGLTSFGVAIYGSALRWVVILAPLALVFFLGFRINRMSVQAAQTTFW